MSTIELDVPKGQITTAEVMAAISEHIEDTDTPDAILAALREHEGKRLNKPMIRKIAEKLGIEDLRILKQYGNTSIGYGRQNERSYEPAVRLIVAYEETNVTINGDWIEEHNAAHFSAAKQRNEQRRALLLESPPLRMRAMADAINVWREACRTLKTAIGGHTDHDGDFINPDIYVIERLATGKE